MIRAADENSIPHKILHALLAAEGLAGALDRVGECTRGGQLRGVAGLQCL